MRGEAVAERVRRHARGPRDLLAAREQPTNGAWTEAHPATRHEQRRAGGRRAALGFACRHDPLGPLRGVGVERRARLAPDRHDAILASLALPDADVRARAV